MMERREFIRACIVLLGSGALTQGCGSSDDTNVDTDGDSSGVIDSGSSGLSRNTWENLTSLAFSVGHPTVGVVDMTMIDIEDGFYSPETEQFSIILSGPETPLFAEGLYPVYNASLGDLELFLQPSVSPAGTQRYRIVFSLLI